MKLLEADCVSYKYDYDECYVIKDLSFSLEREEYLSLPLGYGKTTLAKLLGGLLTPTEGRIFYEGNELTFISPDKRNIAVIFADYALMHNKTVFDNVAFGLRLRNADKRVIDKTVSEAAELFGLNDKLSLKAKTLNRLDAFYTACARAYVRAVDYLVLDDVYNGMVGEEKSLAENAVLKLKQARRCAVLEIYDKGEAYDGL